MQKDPQLRAAIVAALHGERVCYYAPDERAARARANRILRASGLPFPPTLTIAAPPTLQPAGEPIPQDAEGYARAVKLGYTVDESGACQPVPRGPSVAQAVRALVGSALVRLFLRS